MLSTPSVLIARTITSEFIAFSSSSGMRILSALTSASILGCFSPLITISRMDLSNSVPQRMTSFFSEYGTVKAAPIAPAPRIATLIGIVG